MKRVTTYFIATFVALTAFAEEIDAEIIKNLGFFENMPVVEELDLIELEEKSRPPEQSASDDSDSLDEAVQSGATPDGSSKGEGQ